MRKIDKFISTLFFIGFCPFAPGTAASLLAVFVYFLVRSNVPLHFFLTVFFLALGFWSTSRAENSFSRKDPPQIVIDEFSSMLLAYLFIPFRLKFVIVGFFLFRFLDIFKIPPIKKLQTLPKGYGIMLDDIAAAILTNLVLQILRFF